MFHGRFNARNEFTSLSLKSIRDTGSLHEKILNALQSAAKRIGLAPSRPYSEINLIRSRSIGLMVPNLANAFNTEVLRGIEAEAKKSGFLTFVVPMDKSLDAQSRLLEDLLDRHTGGLIVFSSACSRLINLKKVCSAMRIVSMQADIKGVDSIAVTDEKGMYEATEHLLNLGHTQFAYIGYDNNLSYNTNRVSGFKSALRKNKAAIDESRIHFEHSTSSGYTTAKKLLTSKSPPTAIQCVNDHLAMGVFIAASELGIRIPQDISVSGFDDTIVSRLMTPNLTTVSQPKFEMGEAAAQLLIKRIIGDDRTEPRSIVLPTKLIIRDSTAKACR